MEKKKIFGLLFCFFCILFCGTDAMAAEKKDDMITITLCEKPDMEPTRRIKVKKGEKVNLPVLEDFKEGDSEYWFLGWRRENRVGEIANPRFYRDCWLYSTWGEKRNGHPITGWLPVPAETKISMAKKQTPVLSDLKGIHHKKIRFVVKWDTIVYRYCLLKKLQIKYADNKEFKDAKKFNVKYTRDAITLKGLEKGKTYYIKVRGYKQYQEKNFSGGGHTKWSKVYKVKL